MPKKKRKSKKGKKKQHWAKKAVGVLLETGKRARKYDKELEKEYSDSFLR